MTPFKIVAGDLLFHAVHGLCRVDRLIEQDQLGKKILCYSLVPKTPTRMKVRFVIAAADMEASGFHRLVSVKEAKKILDYLKAGNSSIVQTNQTWALARAILSFSVDKLKTRDQRKRQMLERSAKGLVEELACVLKMTIKETASRIGKSLMKISSVDPLVLAALGRVTEG